jgi:hypothetical protein
VNQVSYVQGFHFILQNVVALYYQFYRKTSRTNRRLLNHCSTWLILTQISLYSLYSKELPFCFINQLISCPILCWKITGLIARRTGTQEVKKIAPVSYFSDIFSPLLFNFFFVHLAPAKCFHKTFYGPDLTNVWITKSELFCGKNNSRQKSSDTKQNGFLSTKLSLFIDLHERLNSPTFRIHVH